MFHLTTTTFHLTSTVFHWTTTTFSLTVTVFHWTTTFSLTTTLFHWTTTMFSLTTTVFQWIIMTTFSFTTTVFHETTRTFPSTRTFHPAETVSRSPTYGSLLLHFLNNGCSCMSYCHKSKTACRTGPWKITPEHSCFCTVKLEWEMHLTSWNAKPSSKMYVP